MPFITIALGALAGLAWLSFFVHWVWSLSHLSGRRSVGQMLFRGYEAFIADNFTPAGRAIQRRMTLSFVAFVVDVVLLSILSARAA